MDEHTHTVLEFPKVIERLARLCAFEPGREVARSLGPVFGTELVKRRTRTREAMRLLEMLPGFGIPATPDPRATVEEAALGGTVSTDDLQTVRTFIASVIRVRSTFRSAAAEVPFLATLAESSPQFADLDREIGRALDARGEIADSASAELGTIRAELRAVHGRLTARINEIIASPAFRTVLQEPVATIRDGRYVVPVKAEHKSAVRGVVHDTSTSGATLFIEPIAVVEMNNRWRELQLEERREVERILRQLSRRIGNTTRAFRIAIDVLAELDVCVARARLAQDQQAALPEIAAFDGEVRPELRLVAARHPLLHGEVVPLDLELTPERRCLVITGPNTGGKTVALKTAGLLSLMALTGLAIPAADESRIPEFAGIFADIGDEQSIEQSLSTFGGHMRNIVVMLERCDERSLLLVDELGAGTDPAEGSALARAILEHLAQGGIMTIATTHHSEIKAFAHQTPGLRNASMEFDPETLAPTYRLVLDIPGRSNAFEIARRIGLAGELVERARSLQPEGAAGVDALVQELHALRAEAREARERARREAAQAAALRQKHESEAAAFEETKRQQLDETRESLARYRREIETRLRRIARQLSRLEEGDRARVGQLHQQLDNVAIAAPPRKARPRRVAEHAKPVQQVRPGDLVFIPALETTGTVLEAPPPGSDEALLQVGEMRARVEIGELRQATRAEKRRVADREPVLVRDQPPDPWLSPELDVRGMRADDAGRVVDRFLNDAFLAGITSIRIIHGKGTGALRQTVRDELSQSSIVESMAAGEEEEGGDGVTTAVLARR